MRRIVTAAALLLAGVAAAQHGPHDPAKSRCPDKCHCAETGKCRCVQCPTEMSGGLVSRAVKENRRLVAFVGVKPRAVAGCLTYGTAFGEPGRPSRYVAVFVPDGKGGGARRDLPPDATDKDILAAGTPGGPVMPKTR